MLFNCVVGEDSWESLGLQGDWTSEISPEYSLERLMLKLKLQYFGHLMKSNSLEKTLIDAGKDWRQEKGMTEDEIVGWHHWHNGHGFQQAMGVGDGQGGLECHSPWGRKELHMTEWLNWTEETKWLAFLSPPCEESRRRILTMLTEKNTHLKKVRSYVLFGDLTEDYSLGVNLSDSSEELFQRGKGGNQGEGRGRHVKKK